MMMSYEWNGDVIIASVSVYSVVLDAAESSVSWRLSGNIFFSFLDKNTKEVTDAFSYGT